MTTNSKFFIGVDVSKLYFDAALMVVIDHVKQPIENGRFDNCGSGLKSFYKWLRSFKVTMDSNTLIVIENTGLYHRPLREFCQLKKLPLHIGNANELKNSFGITRGKNDLVDSLRLCQYASKNYDSVKPSPDMERAVLTLQDVLTSRNRLLAQLNANKVYLNEIKGVSDAKYFKQLHQCYQKALDGLEASIKVLDEQINTIVTSNPLIHHNYKLLITCPGIGRLTAAYLICCTNNFYHKISGKQLACYAGVVPFARTSGSSLNGKDHVHHMANKQLKKMLHLNALSVIKNYAEFRNYYERKKAEGKNSMSVLNAIRNKILLRAAAVINNQQTYVDKSNIAA